MGYVIFGVFVAACLYLLSGRIEKQQKEAQKIREEQSDRVVWQLSSRAKSQVESAVRLKEAQAHSRALAAQRTIRPVQSAERKAAMRTKSKNKSSAAKTSSRNRRAAAVQKRKENWSLFDHNS